MAAGSCLRANLGEHALAARLYRQVVDFVTHPSRRDDYEGADYFRELAEKEEALAAARCSSARAER